MVQEKASQSKGPIPRFGSDQSQEDKSMQQADRAHSATGTLASPGNLNPITAFMASRRSMLTGTFGATMLAFVPAFAATTRTPVMDAIAAHIAAEKRFCGLPDDLERKSPSMFEQEADRLHAAWEALKAAEPTTWGEFTAQIAVLTSEGASGLDESDVEDLLRRARRLERVA